VLCFETERDAQSQGNLEANSAPTPRVQIAGAILREILRVRGTQRRIVANLLRPYGCAMSGKISSEESSSRRIKDRDFHCCRERSREGNFFSQVPGSRAATAKFRLRAGWPRSRAQSQGIIGADFEFADSLRIFWNCPS
jgi:hypothetical protein